MVPVDGELRQARQVGAGLQQRRLPPAHAGAALRLRKCSRSLCASSSKPQNATAAQLCDGGGYFSASPARNPLMHDWHQVFVPYLDGGSFAGTGQGAQHDDEHGDGQTLYYRGRNILE